jgi:hypothetical protein
MNTLNQQNIDLCNGTKRFFLFLTPTIREHSEIIFYLTPNTKEQNEIILYVMPTLGRVFS